MNPLPTNQRGAALVIVLSILVLLVTLLIAFMTSSRNDLVATSQYAAGQEAAALAETATSLVMAQIREATVAGLDAQGRGTHAWASQPGALRVWNNQGQPASPYLYKLYSASRMKEDDLSFLAGEIPPDWRTQTAAYTDVNEPVDRNGTWTYPVLNPAAIGTVEGFSSTQAADPSVAWDARCSMPVRWLYIGRDGTISNSLQPDSVGRVAFWTDDETCKVNINTASANADQATILNIGGGIAANQNRLGYSFWAVPHTHFMQEYNFGRANPAQDEFQRYASHPASVNILTVLKGPAFHNLSVINQLNTLRDAFNLFPRYRWGGSENSRYTFTQAAMQTNITGANQKQERLYASVDEFAFAQSKTSALRDRNALPSADPSGPTDEERLDRWRFFLTATSRAPDTNLFGQPRVSLWPISGIDDNLHRTAQDNLIAFCSTVGTGGGEKEFYFQRLYPFSQTADWTEFPRNEQIFKFLQRSTSTALPGFGGNFVTKYDTSNGGVAGERDQILTALFDYIRIANLNETFAGRPGGFRSYTPDTPEIPEGTTVFDAVLAPLADTSPFPQGRAGAGTVFPILTPFGRGAGRVPVVSELVLHLIQRGEAEMEDNGSGTMVPTGNTLPTDTVQSAFFIETFTPTLGYMPWTPRDFQATLTSSVEVNGVEVFPGAAAGRTSTPMNRHTASPSRQPVGGTNGIWDLGVRLQGISGKNLLTTAGNVEFGRTFLEAIPASGTSVALGNGEVEIVLTMRDASGAPWNYQSYTLLFPGPVLPPPMPMPVIPPIPSAGGGDWHARNLANTHLYARPEDVVRSIVPRDGDYRIIAYLQNVPHQFFRPHPDFDSGGRFAHSVRFRRDGGWRGNLANLADGTTNGGFVGLSYHRTAANEQTIETHAPDIPPDITDLVSRGWEGDWNNGVGNFPDGAYLNKPDEGMNRLGGNPNYFMETRWSQAEGFYSPTLAMPSAMVFGSIPTAVRRTLAAYSANNFSGGRPWRTLLFCPNPDFEISGPGGRHYGATDPPDYLLADLFNMPVVEPYAISEPLSTAGRINMNYRILPFTGIERSTALHAVFSGQRVGAIPNSASEILNLDTSQANNTRIHHQIDTSETLRQFTGRFDAGDLFRSAAEICSLFLVPQGQSLAGIRPWWAAHRMTGDNLRERPYATIYPLLTTKSNSYTVHIRAQALAEGKNVVTGEYRGSTTIERYVDPADARIGGGEPDGIDPDTQSLEPLYRFRVVDTKRFAP